MLYLDTVKGGGSTVHSPAGRIVLAVAVAAAMAVGDARAQADGTVTACASEQSGGVEIAEISYRSDGLRIAGYILRPIGVNRKLPAVIYNRGGNRHFGAVRDRTLAFLKGFARSGYVVLASQYRGGPGSEGRDRFGGDDVNDVLNLVKVAASVDQIGCFREFPKILRSRTLA